MLQPCGHLDFYPNGGRDQPGCNPVDIPLDMITEDMVTGGRELVACNHLRSIEFFIDSLVPGYNYVGYECIDYDTFHRVRDPSYKVWNFKQIWIYFFFKGWMLFLRNRQFELR